MDILDTMQISGSGLTAERIRLQSVASNLANARTTRTAEGGPYQRRAPIFEAVSLDEFGEMLDRELSEVQVTEVKVANSAGRKVFDPAHPDADADGYVTFPDIDVLQEMVDLMTTTRAYEANANVLDTTRDLAMRALEIGR
ncbi:MAG: flagellar basal body rod protein FlgC [Myxococcales bacterium]|nr:flagellar basal body rod protein FlgC [Myxococcales bacterium]